MSHSPDSLNWFSAFLCFSVSSSVSFRTNSISKSAPWCPWPCILILSPIFVRSGTSIWILLPLGVFILTFPPRSKVEIWIGTSWISLSPSHLLPSCASSLKVISKSPGSPWGCSWPIFLSLSCCPCIAPAGTFTLSVVPLVCTPVPLHLEQFLDVPKLSPLHLSQMFHWFVFCYFLRFWLAGRGTVDMII